MRFDATIEAFAAALREPSAPPPSMTRGRLGEPDARRFSIYRNNVAVGLIGALEARYPVCRAIAGEDLFRAMARAFVNAHKPRSPVMIAYGDEFPQFAASYLATAAAGPSLEHHVLGRNRHREERSDAAIQRYRISPSSLDRFPCARDDDRGWRQFRHDLSALPDLARLENAWVEAYHAEDAPAATLDDLRALTPDELMEARITFHPGARLLRFATPAASIWAARQTNAGPAASAGAVGEDALVTRPDSEVRVRILPPFAYEFATKLRDGASLGEAAQSAEDSEFDFGRQLVGLVESGAVASISLGSSS
jgi:hypothetical protein